LSLHGVSDTIVDAVAWYTNNGTDQRGVVAGDIHCDRDRLRSFGPTEWPGSTPPVAPTTAVPPQTPSQEARKKGC